MYASMEVDANSYIWPNGLPNGVNSFYGFVKIPEGPGLGIEIDEEHVKKMAAIGHSWKNPIWRHDDNSIAEW